MVAERGGERGSSEAEDGGRWGGWGEEAGRWWGCWLGSGNSDYKIKAKRAQVSQRFQNHWNPGQHQRFGRGFTARESSRDWKPRLLTLTVISWWHTGVQGAPLQPPAKHTEPLKKNNKTKRLFYLIFCLVHTCIGIFLCLDFFYYFLCIFFLSYTFKQIFFWD